MIKLFELIKTKRHERRLKQAKWMLGIMIAKKDPDIYHQLTEIAKTMANQIAMNWLDSRRINHCHLCPNTAPLLKSNEDKWICKPHFEMIAVAA